MEFNPGIEEKRWKPEFEEELIEKWSNESWWKLDLKNKKIFVIDTPPPYPAPFWHIGAAISYSMQDMIARIKRMQGYTVLYPIGMDRNGIPIEMYVEKYENLDMWSTPREEFERLCKQHLDKWTTNTINIMKRLGLSGDYTEHYYETDSPSYRALTQKTFKILWEKGLIYEAERPNNWCPHCNTTIADAEVEYKEKQGEIYHIKFKVRETGKDLIIATTRPELLAGCKLVIVHPEDERYKELHGMHAVVPIYNTEVEIRPHREADPEFGTGAVMICSYGDSSDVRIFREQGLEPVKVIGTDNKLTEAAGKYKGLTPEEARREIVKDLEEQGLIVKREQLTQKIPIHDKCRTRIEIIPMREYYLKQVDFKDQLLEYASQILWHPERYRQHLENWINSVTIDWPISRRRYYGTEIPIWKCKKCGYIHIYEKDDYVKPWKQELKEKCPKCGSTDWEPEWRTLDTWMDSSITILYITKWLRDKEFFEKCFLNGEKLRPQGYEIIRTWLYYSLLRVGQLIGKRAFDHVFINGMGLDAKGRKMSKSLGNVLYPEELIEKYGADSLRMWIGLECGIGENYNISEEKIRGAQKFLVKLWNIARFISAFPLTDKVEELEELDKWILGELEELRKRVLKNYEEFDFHKAALDLRSFTWNIFASHYLELVKRRARMDGFNEKEARSAWYTLHKTLKTLLLLLAPIVPFITDKIWRQLYSKESIHKEPFPESVIETVTHRDITEKITEFNSRVWNTKKEKGIKFYEPIQGIEIPEELRIFEKDIRATHRLE
ncbi:valine--tRNA ligase [Candidatus Woesearchaeota archaeon]|nr:valine--tRNA ligase [Candidatus Woesearchaeota archaeon]